MAAVVDELDFEAQEFELLADDELIDGAGKQSDPKKRMAMLRDAEQILVEEMPIAPIYFYTSLNVAKTNIENFFPTAQDLHPLHLMRYRDEPVVKE